MDPTAAEADEYMKHRYELFKGGQGVNFYAPLLTSGLSQQNKVLPFLTHCEIKMVKGEFYIVIRCYIRVL